MSGTVAPIDLTAIATGTGGFVIYGQNKEDHFGYSVASVGDINGDGFGDLIIGAPDGDGPNNSLTFAGESYVVFGKASGWGAPIDLATIAGGTGGFVIYGRDSRDFLGRSVASAGDINGDGFSDLIIGAAWSDAAGNAKSYAGDTYLVFGKASGWGATIDLANIAAGTGGFVIYGQDADDRSGVSVASAGDINGDGFADLIIGAQNGDAAGNAKNDAGDSYVVFGKASGWGATIDLGTIAAGTGGFVIHGQDAFDRSGIDVASAGDINGDGFDDLIIGAPFGDAAGNVQDMAGDSYVVFGKASGWGAPIDLGTIATGMGGFVIHGRDYRDISGVCVASAGDINGDGFADLIIGARDGDAANNGKYNAGESYVVFGRASGWGAPINLATIAAGTGGFVIHGQDASDNAGYSVASAGDINGDGFADLIIGASGGDAAGNAKSLAGDSYVVFGKASGWGATLDLATIAAGTGGFVIHGQDAGDRSGRSVASAGDINGDGFADLIIGAISGDAAGNATSESGESYVIFGRDFTTTVSHAGTDSADVLTGTGSANVMVAGLGNDTLDGQGGADALKGGAGDDRIQISDLSFLNIDGGTGTDTLALTGSGLTLNLASIGDTKLQDIEAIDLGAGGNTLRLTALEVLNLSDTSNSLRITGGMGSGLIFDDSGWVQGATTNSFVTFTNGAATAQVAEWIAFPPLPPTAGNDSVMGSMESDALQGLAGNDTLSGGGGADTMGGGAGDDLFFVSDAADTVMELAGGGADTITTSISMTMADHVEAMHIASGISGITITGGAGNDMLMGNGLANTFNGGAGDDVILAGNVTLADIYALFAT